MPFLSDGERKVLESISTLIHGNPFLPERVEAERGALGRDFVPTAAVWHVEADLNGINPNLPKLQALVERLASDLRDRLSEGRRGSPEEIALYQGLVFQLLYQRFEGEFFRLVGEAARDRSTTKRIDRYPRFVADVEHFFGIQGVAFAPPREAAEMFALGYQARRAFHHTFRQIYGGSMAAARLRAQVWESIFTHDPPRYRRALRSVMADVPTLIMGETGTGKELVARAIAFSRFIPFDGDSQCFVHDFAKGFRALNLSALSPTLIESELFGHRRGAFTGALEDREGWLESCGPNDAVFLDEVGELDPTLQVKLLRVLQSRSFQRIGETKERRFEGKIVAATNRDLGTEMRSGRFRPDFYYRLCADVIHTPPLREQLAGDPLELRNLAVVLARRIVGPEEAEPLADETVAFVEAELGADYPWPGNVRELEQCVRNILVRGTYRPARETSPEGGDLAVALREGRLTADELLRRYVTQVYAQAGSYEEAARRLGLDRRTVKAKIDPEWLERLRS